MIAEVTMIPVESSNVAAVGYDEPTGTLAVEFISGAVYHYHDVEPDVWRGLKAVVDLGGSVGKYVSTALVKGVRYCYTRIE